ncbi:MAG: hypothetical protein COU71_02050 [Parcubacteria group bacterium CG10_big_fil_rev_8_21_14_0_10_38_31]|nr:MAG: hypothetical protein COU71_02050 [Parcubacteria group bacterium CG10_big_fil_rev_8_21_14_0_10_38_31]
MIKNIIKKIILFILKIEARLILWRYRPKIIAITGTVGKTSAKDAIGTIFSREFYARKSDKSYNSEFGVPLTIIGAKSAFNNLFKWFLIFLKGIKLLIVKHDYPEMLILEVGVDRPDDMSKLTSWLNPDTALVTGFGNTPVHIEFFKNVDELMREKSKLIRDFTLENHVVLNGDDPKTRELKNRTKANVVTYGFNEDNDLIASNYRILYKDDKDSGVPEGIIFKVDYKGKIIPIRLYNIFGKQAVYSVLSALAMGVVYHFNIIEMSNSLTRYRPPVARLNLISGIGDSFILDDTYNASPLAVEMALNTLDEIKTKGRKIAVLGDMLELGKYSADEHRKVGEKVLGIADIIVTVGIRAKFIAEGAKEAGFREKNIYEFGESREAGRFLIDIIKEGDLILVKGSQSIRTERVVEEIMAHPENKEFLLARQEKEWLNK